MNTATSSIRPDKRAGALRNSKAASAIPTRRTQSAHKDAGPVIDLGRYVPAYFTWISNKLSGGASQVYLAACGVGIESWRLLVLLAIEQSLSAQRVCKVIGMDKASVSRAFKSMQARGLITIGLDTDDGRLRVATITRKGRELHDKIVGIALERERAFLSVLKNDEREVLIGLLHRLHDNLPQVEEATAKYLVAHFPAAKPRARGERQ